MFRNTHREEHDEIIHDPQYVPFLKSLQLVNRETEPLVDRKVIMCKGLFYSDELGRRSFLVSQVQGFLQSKIYIDINFKPRVPIKL